MKSAWAIRLVAVLAVAATSGCGPVDQPAAPTTPATVTVPASTTPPPTAPPSSVLVTRQNPAPPVVRAGSFCSPAGAYGVTSAGTPMVCTTTATDPRNRWRAQ